jgi:hypothetical protein
MHSTWNGNAVRWRHIGPPLRPCREDLQYVGRVIREESAAKRGVRVLLLGVTPEFARLSFSRHDSLIAVDNNWGMIKNVWPGYPRPGDGVLCGDWRALPLRERSVGVVLGDGCFSMMRYPGEYATLAHSIRRVLSPGGLCVIRFYIQPEQREQPPRWRIQESPGAARRG